MDELDMLADRLRLVIVRLRIERVGVVRPDAYSYTPLAWEQLTESERNQWREHARACQEVLP